MRSADSRTRQIADATHRGGQPPHQIKRRNKAMTKDGWHLVYGYMVYTENGRVLRALSDDGQRALYPYRWSEKLQCRTECTGIALSTLRAGLKTGTIILR